MPARKSKSRRRGSRGSLRASFLSILQSPLVSVAVWVVLGGLLAFSQFLFFKGKFTLGFFLSLFSFLGGLLFYFRDGNFSLGWLQDLLPPSPKGAPAFPKKSDSFPTKSRASLVPFKPKDSVSLAMLGVALFSAILGQIFIIQVFDDNSLWIGLAFYALAVGLFLSAFWRWPKEGLRDVPFPRRLETLIFVAILLVALILRIYRLMDIPSGLFVDQGFQGLMAEKIIHEGPLPIYVESIWHLFTVGLYMLAGWFKVFGDSELSFRLFYVFISIATFPLVYWTIRQLSGVRTALLTVGILALMRWNIIFSRNSFPTVQMPLFLFGALAFLLYGMRTKKTWAFAVAAAFFAGGFYIYQAFKVTPLLFLAYGIYEFCADRKRFKQNAWNIVFFFFFALAITIPVLKNMHDMGGLGTREKLLSIFNKVHEQGSIKPFFEVLTKTALMFNRKGDHYPRHNLLDYRMLDDVSGVLFVLGIFYALFRIKRRKYFYAVAGFFVLSLPCILSIDWAHANRMFSMTPWIAFFIATPVSALWARVRAFKGERGERVYFSILALPLIFMAWQNYDVYFNKEANNICSWSEFEPVESEVGRSVAKYGGKDECFVPSEYFEGFTFLYLSYPHRNQAHYLNLPDALAPVEVPADRGLFYAIPIGRPDLLGFVQALYPGGVSSALWGVDEKPYIYYYEVPGSIWAKSKGLMAKFSNQTGEVQEADFPKGLPAGPYHASFRGHFLIPQGGIYVVKNMGKGKASFKIDGVPVRGPLKMMRRYYSIEVDWDAPVGEANPDFQVEEDNGRVIALNQSTVTTLEMPKGMLAKYYVDPNWKGKALQEQWEFPPNYINERNFPIKSGSSSWEGKLEVPATGDYTFFVLSDGETGLFMDGRKIGPSNNGGSREIHLTKGKHDLKVVCSQAQGATTMVLQWVRPDTHVREIIPAQAFP